MKNLIVNADDLGWTAGVNRGIAQAHRNGIVTSASLLANGSAFADGVETAHALPGLGVGVHLNLSDGRPTAPAGQVKSLLNEEGKFAGGPESLLLRLSTKSLLAKDVEKEWDAQISKVRDAGIQPSHLDGHKHVQMLPGLFAIALRLARKHGIAAVRVSHEASPLRTALTGEGANAGVVLKQGVQARGLKLLARDARALAERSGISTADYFCGIAQTGILTKAGVAKLLKSLPQGTTELMCHPGYVDDDLRNSGTRLRESRQVELEILTDKDIRKSIADLGIRLINYAEIAVPGR
ncbi:MAG TPA: ChbG/HpnK family deacetylase [Candidatus Acidoferrum sp.]|nr:ChbG/HpnK family deacetylase [Candidatus Acidoferrum sp.]